MHTGQRYSFREFVIWTRRDTYGFVAIGAAPTLLYQLLGLRWLSLPWVPIALVGTAAAFIVGFRNNATYGRLWEARQIYGGIVNVSRTWALMVRDFVVASPLLSEDDAKSARSRLVHRHIAWLTALRFQLRQPRAWESMSSPHNAEYRDRLFTVDELVSDLGSELAKILPAEEHARVMAGTNRAVHIVALQGEQLAVLAQANAIEPNARVELERVLADLYNHQGRAERIKNFPYPRQFASINTFFVRAFIWLVPFGLIGELAKLSPAAVWMAIPFTTLIAWIFNGMERVGESSENPFEGSPNDIPITAMSRAIEIDLREMLGETDIPPAIAATHQILM